MSDKCFKKCVSKPGTSLDSSEQASILWCWEIINLIADDIPVPRVSENQTHNIFWNLTKKRIY